MIVNNNHLPQLFQRGLIPGPAESEELFLNRLSLLQSEKVLHGDEIPETDWNTAFDTTRSIYGIAPDWVAGFLSHKKLSFWEAGATWELADGQCAIQVNDRKAFALRTEVLAHELVHVARSAFEEPRFEELLAYRTSSKPWRRWIGPLFRRPWQAWLMIASTIADMGMIWNGMFPCFTLALLGGFIVFLGWDQRRLLQCLKRLPSAKLVLCLTDREIVSIAKGSNLGDLDDGSLRWQMIKSFESGRVANSATCGI